MTTNLDKIFEKGVEAYDQLRGAETDSDTRYGRELVNEAKAKLQQYVDSECLKARRGENRISHQEVSRKYRSFGTRSDYQSKEYIAEGRGIMLKTAQAQKVLDKRLAELNTGGNKDEPPASP